MYDPYSTSFSCVRANPSILAVTGSACNPSPTLSEEQKAGDGAIITMQIQKPVPPEIDGYLTKLKSKQSIFGSWATRYFQVNGDLERIEYFKMKQQAVDSSYSTGHIDLWDITSVRVFDGNTFQVEAGKKVLLLKADSAAERACWVSGLQNYLAERLEYESQMALSKNYAYKSKMGSCPTPPRDFTCRSKSRSSSTWRESYN